DVLRLVKDNDVKFIRLWFTDMLGQLKSFAITSAELEHAIDDGMGFDGSSVTGYQDIEESDMIAKPDPATFQMLPWRPKEQAVARMFCDVMTPYGQPYDGDPRYILKKAIKRANDMGFDHFYVGPELEYFYFQSPDGTDVLDKSGYFDLNQLDAGSDIRRDTILTLEAMGIRIEYSHHEVAPSQHEIDMRYADALQMADNVMTYRLVVKETAQKYGVYATFMPKPIFGQNGSGMHTHQSLFNGNDNAFFDTKDKYHLSDTAKKYIAGQLTHAREMSCVFAQWTNSYKRLVPGYEAPVYVAWSQRNRSALVRIPLYHPGKEQATRMELRCPDPACNPYLTFALLLHAGLDGIEKGYELPDPMDKNLYHLTPEERDAAGIKMLPGSLGEAIGIAKNSEFVRKALGEHIFPRFIAVKE
ncbi:MAG: glutamine synthetase family protein, partial [Candidatus Desantisbacteria bacterium]